MGPNETKIRPTTMHARARGAPSPSPPDRARSGTQTNRVPVLSIAGKTDTLAPRPAVHHVAELLVQSAPAPLETAELSTAERRG